MSNIYSPSAVKKELNKTGMPIDKDWQATQHFSWTELLLHQKEIPSIQVLENLLQVTKILEIYREKLFFNSPITITSGWRSVSYNEKIGGARNSQHVLGNAIDFVVKGFSTQRIYDLLDKVHFGGLEFAPSWTHIDTRGKVERFDNQNKLLASHFNLYNHNVIFHPQNQKG